MDEKELQIIIRWLRANAYAAIGEQYWLLRDFPADKVPERLHIPISSNTKIWRIIKNSPK